MRIKLARYFIVLFRVLLVLAFLGPHRLFAGTNQRTVYFSGTAIAKASTGTIHNSNMTGVCSVVIVNVGSSDQVIDDIQFHDYNASTGRMASSLPTQMAVRASATPTATQNTTCIGQVLKPDNFCIARFVQETFSLDERVLTCVGKISVSDSNSFKDPGVVVAAGTLSLYQESMVLGGTLSGAFYQSPPHVRSSDANLAEQAGKSLGSVQGNMNIYCNRACQDDVSGDRTYTGWLCAIYPSWSCTSFSYTILDKYKWNAPMPASACAQHCGYATGYGGVTKTFTGWNTKVNGEWDPGNVTALIKRNPFPWTARTQWWEYLPSQLMKTANGHYAGGMVYEMMLGPMVSVCSGNEMFYENGGGPFVHSDGIDASTIIRGDTFPTGPEERLVCSHRHAGDDLFFRNGSSTGFPINRGSPF